MKKGQAESLLLLNFFEFVIGMLVAGILIYGAYQFAGNDQFDKQYIAKDISLMIDTSYLVSGDLDLTLPVVGERDIGVNEGKAGYYRVLVDDDIYTESYFGYNKNLNGIGFIENANGIRFLKENKLKLSSGLIKNE